MNIKQFNKYKEDYFSKNNLIRNVWIWWNWQLKNLLKKWENLEEVELFATLCPFYDWENIWIKWDYENFSEVEEKYQNKLQASLELIKFFWENFNLKIKFLLADRGVLLSDKYNLENFDEDISWTKKLYREKISETLWEKFDFQTFTDFWITIPQISKISEKKSRNETLEVLENFWVDSEKFKFNLEIIEKSFWETWAYYLISSYLEENRQFLEKISDWIFLNVEATWPLNSLYEKWRFKMNEKNIFAKVELNPKYKIWK